MEYNPFDFWNDQLRKALLWIAAGLVIAVSVVALIFWWAMS